MENEITTSQDFRGHFEEAFWTYRNVYGNKPLAIYHVIPSFMVLGLGLIPSIIIFILELLTRVTKKRVSAEPIPENHAFSPESGNGTDSLSNVIDEKKDNNDTIRVMTEIQEALSMDE